MTWLFFYPKEDLQTLSRYLYLRHCTKPCYFYQENGNSHSGDHETVKLTKDVSWEEEEEEVTEHYLKIYAKYITDGQVFKQLLHTV